MNHIDELFHDIDEKETVEIESSMDKEKQQRIETMIMKGIKQDNYIEDVKNDVINDVNNEVINLEHKKSKKRFSKKKFVALILAATFLMGMTVYAAEKNEWDIAIVNYMGISNADTVQLPDGVVEIGASALSNGVTMKAVTSVGDKNSAYIRIDTNYKLPSTFNEKTDYIITKGWDTRITKTVMGLDMNYGGSLMYFNNKGYLSFMMYISNSEGINRKNVKVTFTDLYIYHDLHPQTEQETNQETDHGTLLLSGKWTLSWKYHYRSNVNTYYPMKLVVSNGETCLVTKLEISPLTIRAEAVKNPTQGRTEASRLLIKKITMKDGSVIEFDQKSTSGGCRNNTFLEGYRDVMEMGKAIDPSKVYSITIGDEEIIL